MKTDHCHCSISLRPGHFKAHIYVTKPQFVPIESMRVVGESVVWKRSQYRDPTLSFGYLPAMLLNAVSYETMHKTMTMKMNGPNGAEEEGESR